MDCLVRSFCMVVVMALVGDDAGIDGLLLLLLLLDDDDDGDDADATGLSIDTLLLLLLDGLGPLLPTDGFLFGRGLFLPPPLLLLLLFNLEGFSGRGFLLLLLLLLDN